MNKSKCSHCSKNNCSSETRTRLKSTGSYYRKSDRKLVKTYQCLGCGRYFSGASANRCYRQNKRHLNETIRVLFASGLSQRRLAKILRISRTTVARKLVFLGLESLRKLEESNLNQEKATVVEFDDLETFEHTKCKPLSVTLAVESRTRRILGFEVARMGAKGRLTQKSLKKYGKLKEERSQARNRLFFRMTKMVESNALIKSDENPYYPRTVKKFFPEATHISFKGQRGAVTGQGELKKIGFDPIFSLNHTCAMFRANVNRLFRKTWCTTKKAERLALHLAIYAYYHNHSLIAAK